MAEAKDVEKLIDQKKLAQGVAEKIPYNFKDKFLVKPLDPIKVEKEFSTPVPKTNKPKKDKNGIAAVDYDEVKTEKKQVDADFRLGVVLKVPYNYCNGSTDAYKPFPIMVGDVVIYHKNTNIAFDLLKDSVLVSTYDIVGTMDTKKDESK